jgi:hypothetical protein
MVGQGVLRECVLNSEVSAVLSVVRKTSAGGVGAQNEKVRELVTDNFYDFFGIASELAGYEACFFCLGVSSFRMKEEDYRRVTYDITMAAAKVVVNPALTFCYVSGAGTDANGKQMWARVKGATENTLLAMPFKAAYMFRPGGIMPMDGIASKTGVYRVAIAVLKPFFPMLVRWFPQYVTTTRQMGRAMLAVTKHGFAKPVLEAVDIAKM